MATRKEYEFLFTLKANMDSAFQGSFQKSSTLIKDLQSKVNEAKRAMGDISAVNKLNDAMEKNKTAIEANKQLYEKLKKTLSGHEAELEKYTKRLSTAQEREKAHKTALESLKKAYGDTSQLTATQTKRLAEMQAAYEKTKTQVANLKNSVEDAGEKIANTTEKLSKKERQLENNNKALVENKKALEEQKKILSEAGVNTENLTAENERLTKSYESLRAAQNKLGAADKAIAANRAAYTTAKSNFLTSLYMARYGAQTAYNIALEPSMEFNARMSEVEAISGASRAESEILKDAARQAGLTTKFTASESGQALEYMALAGWKTGEMTAGLSGILSLAAAGNADLGTTSDIVTDALTAFGMKASQSDRLADIMAATMANSNTDIEKMGESFKYAAPLAGAYGFTPEDTALLLGLEANAGIKGRTGGTSLRTIFTKLSSDIKMTDASGKEITVSVADEKGNMRDLRSIITDLRAAFKGMSAESKNAIDQNLIASAQELGISLTDDAGSAKSAAALFGEISEELENMTEAGKIQEAEAIGGKTAMSGLLAIMNASEEEYQNLADAIYNSDGAAKTMADTMLNNLKGDVTIAKSAAEGFGIALGDILTPELRSAAQWGASALQSMAEWAEKNPGIVKAIAGTATGIVGLNLAILGAKLGFTAANKPILLAKKALAQFGVAKTAAGGITSLSGKVKVFSAALTGIASPGGIAITVIAGLAAAGFVLYKHLEKAKEEWRNYGDEVEEAADAMKTANDESEEVSKMRDRYKDLGKAISDGALSAEELKDAQKERQDIEQWFIDHFPEFCNAEQQKRDEMEKSMDIVADYKDAMADLTASEFEMKLTQLTADLPEYEKEAANELQEEKKYEGLRDDAARASTSISRLRTIFNSTGGKWTDEAKNIVASMPEAYRNLYQVFADNEMPLDDKTLKAWAKEREGDFEKYEKKRKSHVEKREDIENSMETQRQYAEEKVVQELGMSYEEATNKAEAFRKALSEIEKTGKISEETANSLKDYIPDLEKAEDKTAAVKNALAEFEKTIANAAKTAEEYKIKLNGAREGELNIVNAAKNMTTVRAALDKIRTGADLTADEITELEKIIPGIGAQVDKVTPLENCFNKLKTQVQLTKDEISRLILGLENLPDKKTVTVDYTTNMHRNWIDAATTGVPNSKTYPGMLQHNAGGTPYSAEVYIAGENGPELITNARGSRVFTAFQTGRILKSMRESFNSPERAAQYVDESATRGGDKYDINIEFSPTVNGGDTEEIGEILAREREKLIAEVMRKFDERAVDAKRRRFA